MLLQLLVDLVRGNIEQFAQSQLDIDLRVCLGEDLTALVDHGCKPIAPEEPLACSDNDRDTGMGGI